MPDMREQLQEIAAEIRGEQPEQETAEVEEPIENEDTANDSLLTESSDTDNVDEPDNVDSTDETGDDLPADLKTLAESIGVDDAYMYSVKIPMPDGNDPVTLGEMKDRFQTFADKEAELEKQVKEFEEKQTSFVPPQPVNNEAMVAAMSAYNMAQQYLDSPELQELKQSDPGKAALYVQELTTKQVQAQAEYQQAQGQAYQQQQQFQQQQLQQSTEYIKSHIKEWTNKEVMSNDLGEMRSYITKFDYSPNEFDNINDGRLMAMLRQAAKDRAFIEASKKPVKKTTTLKPLRSGGRQPKTNNADKLINQARNTGSKQDQMKAARAVLGI